MVWRQRRFFKVIEEIEREDPTKRMLVSKKAPYNSFTCKETHSMVYI